MNGINSLSSSLLKYIKWLKVFFLVSLVSACGSGSSGKNNPEPKNLDSEAPVITLIGEADTVIEFDSEYTEAGASATDNIDEVVELRISGTVDTSTIGTYEITYSASDEAGNTASITRIVTVQDTVPPTITLQAGSEINIAFGREYIDPGATAYDNVDGNLIVSTSGAVDPTTLGTYQITYTAIDSSGNTSRATRNANVIDITAPIINLNGEAEFSVVQGRDFIDPVSVVDDVDGPLELSITGNVDIDTLGDYTLTYTATDSSGNQSTAKRIITVREFRPFITTWKTNNSGVSADNQITINTSTDNQNYTVDWGDGTQDTEVTGSITHTYSSEGYYLIKISGDFKNIAFARLNNDGVEELHGDTEKIISVSQWGDIQWSTMEYAFTGCNNLRINATDAPDLSNVSSMRGMFYEADSFNQDISHWDVSSVTDMSGLFFGADKFNQDLNDWDVSSVTNMEGLFYQASAFNKNLNQWDVSSVTNMNSMFYYADSFNGLIGEWDTSSVLDMSYMFYEADSFNGNISQWDVSNVTTMHRMFLAARNFNSDLSQWDVSSVTDMHRMFYAANKFNADISLWDMSLVTDISGMFRGASDFSSDISQWNVSAVTNMSQTFRYAVNFNSDIGQWDVSSVTDMSELFYNAVTFNKDISSWNVASVTDMNNMFRLAEAFNQDLNQWNVSSVTDMNGMFNSAKSFTGNISQWNVSKVTNMDYMFKNTQSFNGKVAQWDVSSVKSMIDIFKDITLSIEDYDELLKNWSSYDLQPNVIFHAGNSYYSSESESARNILVNTHNWVISDNGISISD